MCGILGTLPSTESFFFEQALNQLAHRGPDGFGIWSEEGVVSLGHRRLSILDLSENGRQPMEYNDRWVITFNGEIYNFIEIRNELKLKGYKFISDTDTEVILAAYQEWGPLCLQKFNGMWAFAIWDKHLKRLFLSRDRFGIKPLFYAFTEDKFIFASEMKAIFPFLKERKLSSKFQWCLENIYEYEHSPYCLIEGIKRFPAGHYGFVDTDAKKVNVTSYWNTLDNLEILPEKYEKQVDRFRELFFDACKIRMRADVKIGTALSGGLDSSSVTAALCQIGNKNERTAQDWQNAFVATFPNTDLDETHYAKILTEKLGIRAFFQEINPEKGIANLENYLWLFEEIYFTSPIPMIELYKAIKNHGITVSLDGHGADELLSGYGNSLFNIAKEKPFDCRLIKEVIKTYKEIRNIQDNKTLKYLIDGYEGRKNIIKHYAKEIIGLNTKENLKKQKMGLFNQYLYEIFHKTILPTLLRNYDRYSMAASVEVRMPFMDYRLVTYCFSLPWQSKYRNGFTKAILRDAMSAYMPPEITWRKVKTGFGTPFTEWIRGPWKSYFLDIIHSSNFLNSSLIDSKAVKNKIESLISTPTPTFAMGQEAWKAIMPFFWENAVLKRIIK
ncbi:MAG: asparagine synthetase B [Thermonema sp.]|uniref:asparagine synthase (glutamine-hydrolyzing) n=1 Tax=Thermonema sp. TaxID=2231181 RepID=UPI0021DDF4F1|nr:asparagine synthase (glutamine-hydrolyzing) [Thermonema sp.]GIV38765.1 MAG: asparagine synthetase B [Thermonema sp.]